MNRKNRTYLYALLLTELGGSRPSWFQLREMLDVLARKNGIDFTWKDPRAEATSLANEFSTFLDTLARVGPGAQPALPLQANVVTFERTVPTLPPRPASLNFTRFFETEVAKTYDELRARFSEFAHTEEGQVGEIDSITVNRLLNRAAASPFESALAFVEDPLFGVLENEQTTELFQRKTGA